jgi:RND family efflux transporter MFP subunit
MAVKLVQPHRGDITRGVSLPGNVVANQQAALCAKVSGYLKSINVDKGDRVTEGALLAEIEVPELLADETKYKAEVSVAAADYQRVHEAQQKAPTLITPQTVDEAHGRLDVAKANLERAQTLLGFCKITAPFAGVITARTVDPGAFIPAATAGGVQATALLTVADYSKVRVQVAVPEAESPLVRNELPARVTVEELPGENFNASISRFSHALDPSVKTMLVEIDIANPDGRLLPGMYATVKLGMETHKDAQLLPVDAVAFEKIGSAVFTVEGGKTVRVPVKTGFNDSASVEILDGLKPTDSVISLGKRTFTAGQPVTLSEGK